MTSRRNPYLFVAGCPRSGTTLLQRMLNAHPELAVANDTHFVTRAVKRLNVGPETRLDSEIVTAVRQYRRFYRLGVSDADFNSCAEQSTTYPEFVSALYDQFAANEGKPLSGEKTPDYCRSIPLLSRLFPWTYFVHIIRDGRDVALSTVDWAKDGKGPSKWDTWADSPIGTCALWWKWQVGSGIRDGHTVADRYQEVIYNDLVSDPERTMRRVVERIGLEYHPEILQFARGRTRHDPSLSAKSAWLPPTQGLRDWRTQMDDDDVELFECIAGDLLSRMGFERRFESFRPEIADKAEYLSRRSEKKRTAKATTRPAQPSLLVPESSRLEKPAALTVHDHQLIERDRALPGFAEVLDGDRLLDRIRPSLSRDIDRIAAVYVRYKPGTNCLVGYEAEAGGETFWFYAKAHGEGELDKMRKAASRTVEPTKIGPSTMVLEDIGVVVRVFPLDAKLPALWRLQDEADDKITARLFDESEGLRSAVFEPIRWKPERRLVTRMSVGGQPFAAVKFMTYVSFGRTWGFARHGSTAGQYRTPKVIGHSKRLRAIAYEWLDGQVLADAIRQPEFELDQLDPIAAVLAEVHAGSPRNMPTILAGQSIAELEASASALKAVVPELAPEVDRIFARVSEVISAAPVELTFIHGDFYAKQILVNGSEVALLDFDQAALGTRHIDLGNFVSHMHRDSVRGFLSQDRAAEVESRFVETYRSIHPTVDVRMLGAFTAASLLKLAPHPFRFREHDWFEQTRAILKIAESYLKNVSGFQLYPGAGATSNSLHSERARHTGRLVEMGLDHATMEERLVGLLAADNDSGSTLAGIKLVRHKPGRRCLIKYTLSTSKDRSGRSSVLGKIREKGLDQRTFEVTRKLFENSFGPNSEDGIRVPEPLGCIPELNMWVQECVTAPPVTTLLRAGQSVEFGAKVATALYKLHSRGPHVDVDHGIERELDILEKGLLAVGRHRPEWSRRLHILLDRYRFLAASLDVFPAAPIHRDFYPDQVLLDENVTYLIDLDLYSMGDPALDVGNFIAHVREIALRTTGDVWAFEGEVASFKETYLRLCGRPLDQNIHVYTWLSMARHIWISTRIPGRNGVTEQILDACEALKLDRPHGSVGRIVNV